MKEFLWVEKYRPNKLGDCILPEYIFSSLSKFVNSGNFPNLLFNGTPGIGKTAAAVAMIKDIDSDYIIINGSNEGRLIDTLRSNISSFASSLSLSGKRKYVIIDEADRMGEIVQDSFKSFIEKYSNNCGFIFTSNNKQTFTDAIISRFVVIDFMIPKNEKLIICKKMINRIISILQNESIEFNKEVVSNLVVKNFPDFRKTINDLQYHSINGKIDELITNDINLEEYFKLLKEKNFEKVRKWVVKNIDYGIDNILRKMYMTADKYLSGIAYCQLILLIDEYVFKSKFSNDKELSMMALSLKIMSELSENDFLNL